jgi:hypothetical protein
MAATITAFTKEIDISLITFIPITDSLPIFLSFRPFRSRISGFA